jgi:hypothetical protein
MTFGRGSGEGVCRFLKAIVIYWERPVADATWMLDISFLLSHGLPLYPFNIIDGYPYEFHAVRQLCKRFLGGQTL